MHFKQGACARVILMYLIMLDIRLMILEHKTKRGEDCPGPGIAKKYIKFLSNETSFM